MSKLGDAYVRTLLGHGARAVIYPARPDPSGTGWLHMLTGRRNGNVAAMALANQSARSAWVLLIRDRQCRADYAAVSSHARDNTAGNRFPPPKSAQAVTQ